MNRRSFLAALGVAPILAKLGLAKEQPAAPPQEIAGCALGPWVSETYTTGGFGEVYISRIVWTNDP